MRSTLSILCYHRVLPASEKAGAGRPYFCRGTAVSEESFEAQVKLLSTNFDIVDESTAIRLLKGARLGARRACWLTFDDGYGDVLRYAAPILSAVRGVATVFITTNTILRGEVLPVDRWYAVLNGATRNTGRLTSPKGEWDFDLDVSSHFSRLVNGPEKRAFLEASETRRGELLRAFENAVGADASPLTDLYLSVDDLRALVDTGWSVGSHSLSHPILTTTTAEEMTRELVVSRSHLAFLGYRARAFAYPDGAWNEDIAGAVARAGYEVALTLDQEPGATHGPYAVRRRLATEDASSIAQLIAD